MERYYKSIDLKLLWGLSGGICAKCKNSLFDSENTKSIAHQAHIIARKGTKLPSYEEIPLREKDTYPNLILLCPSCHTETTNWSKEELYELKYNHEKHIKDTIKGVFRPYEIGEGKFFTYPYLKYVRYEKPYNEKRGRIEIIILIIAFIGSIGYVFYRLYNGLELISYITFSSFILLLLSISIYFHKLKRPIAYYSGKCTFVGCEGLVTVQEAPNEIKSKYTHIGQCNHDKSHTFTVSKDKTRGNYEKFDIIKIVIQR